MKPPTVEFVEPLQKTAISENWQGAVLMKLDCLPTFLYSQIVSPVPELDLEAKSKIRAAILSHARRIRDELNELDLGP